MKSFERRLASLERILFANDDDSPEVVFFFTEDMSEDGKPEKVTQFFTEGHEFLITREPDETYQDFKDRMLEEVKPWIPKPRRDFRGLPTPRGSLIVMANGSIEE